MDLKKSLILRARIAFLGTVFLAVVIIIKIIHIQVVEGDRWRKAADVNRIEHRSIKATRGNIYACDGSLLATSLPFYRIALDPTIVSDQVFQDEVYALSKVLGAFFKDKEPAAYEQIIRQARASGKRYVLLNKKPVSFQERKEILKWPMFNMGRMRGGGILEKVETRFRPFKQLSRRTVGYINEDNCGAGLEYSFNKVLKGIDGRGIYRKSLGGTWNLAYDTSIVKPVDGYNISTTLDVNFQDVTHNALMRALVDNDADYGAAVVMGVETGEIKAIANLTKIDEGKYAETYNYVVGFAREPGSTVKIPAIIALLEETNLPLSTMVEVGDGTYTFHDRLMRDVWRKGLGTVSLQRVIEKSSNVGVAMLIADTFEQNPEKFINYFDKMGLLKPLGLQLVGEGEPYMKTPKDPTWSGVTLPWTSIGYASKFTPLQILTIFNAIANDGRMIRPLFVKEISRADKVIKTFRTSTIRRQICSRETLAKVKKMMEGVVESGTAQNIKNSFYKIAGKSGTAQRLINGRYAQQWYTSFAGYFPADKPKYSCIVVVDNPRGFRLYGSDMAAPVFKEIADKISAKDINIRDFFMESTLGIREGTFPLIQAGKKEDLINLCNTLEIPFDAVPKAEWVRTAVKDDVLHWRANGCMGKNQVPNVLGMTLRDALYLLESRGLHVTFEGKGRVKSQSLQPGVNATQGGQINLLLE